MSIPDRIFRIARYKLGEIKEHFDRMDDEARADEVDALRRKSARDAARDELADSMEIPPAPEKPRSAPAPPVSGTAPAARRTPEQIAAGNAASASTANSVSTSDDPLLYHYRLLGVEMDADFADVQSAYNRLAARCDPLRFPEGSAEASEAEAIRKRLEASYHKLREALDPTSRRFDLLEFDAPTEAPAAEPKPTPEP